MQATAANQEHYDLLVRAQSSSAKCKQMVTSSDQHSQTSQKLLQEAKKMNMLTRTHFTELNRVYEKLGKLAQDFQSEEADLSTVIKDYKVRYVEPCLQHATQLVSEAEAVSSMFGKDRGMGAKTLEAANAYHSITMTVLQSVRASDAAFTLAIELIERVSRQDERGYDLFAQADVGRVKSRDLRQEAEGLRQNSREMQVQVEELILRWQSYILLVSKRNDDLKAVDRELDRLQIVSVLAEDAVRHSSNYIVIKNEKDLAFSTIKIFFQARHCDKPLRCMKIYLVYLNALPKNFDYTLEKCKAFLPRSSATSPENVSM